MKSPSDELGKSDTPTEGHLSGKAANTPQAATQGLSAVRDGVVATVAFSATPEDGPCGRLFVLDTEGHTVGVSENVHVAEANQRIEFASLPGRDPKFYVVSDGSGPPLIGAVEEALAPTMAPVSSLAGSGLSVVEADNQVFVLMESIGDSGSMSQSILSTDFTARSPRWVEIDITELALAPGRAVSALTSHSGYLYAAVADPAGGCDLFRTALHKPSAEWRPVFSRGANRFALNAAISAMVVHGDQLLVGTAALATGALSVGNWGPELLVIAPDGSWDLLIGQPRLSPGGLRLPASALPPGINSPENAAISAIASGIVGDRQQVFIAIQKYSGPVPGVRMPKQPLLKDYRGAVSFFSSENLVDWQDLDISLPGDAGAVTSLCATEAGLIIGHEGPADDNPPITFDSGSVTRSEPSSSVVSE